MSNALLFAALCLSCYRVWRFMGKDDITAGARAKLPPILFRLVTCPWCLGTWLSFAAVYATHRYLVTLHPHWLLWAVAVSCAVGLIGEKLDEG